MKTLLILILPFFLILSSCDREAQNVTPPEIEAQLVMFSFLSPEDSFVRVEVSMSQPVYGYKRGSNNDKFIDDAVVTIKNDGGFSATLAYIDSNHTYMISRLAFPIEPGRKYTVNVSARGKKADGSCSIPKDTVQFSDITYEQRTDIDGSRNVYLYKWQDQPGITNYYRTSIESVYRFIDFMGDTMLYTNDICSKVFNDENRDGQILSSTCDGYSVNFESDTSLLPVDFYLLNTDIHYYEYHKRRLNYFGDDPFSEPFQQYSNVNGGLGVICSYRLTKRTIMAKP